MNKKPHMIVAVDGYSSTGKSTLAKDIARHYSIKYIDSGAMYRAVTLLAIRQGLYDPAQKQLDEQGLKKALDMLHLDFLVDADGGTQYILMNGENIEDEIRRMEVSQSVSIISRYRFVRDKMVEKQRAFAQTDSLVMDGRDIGTVVFPQADVKIFMTASLEVRARRRYDELIAKGVAVDFEEVEKNVQERDHIDATREESPLRQAEDAVVIDNSQLTREEQLDHALKIIHGRMGV
jgi:cytidylate kinase